MFSPVRPWGKGEIPFPRTAAALGFRRSYVFDLLALRPMAGQRTLDPLMVVRIHQGQLELANSGRLCWTIPPAALC
jgi:hypothetical protein